MQSSKLNSKDFTRKRKMPFPELILFILRGISKSLTVELDSFFSSLGKSQQKVTKQAFSKARMNLRPESLIELNDTLVEEFYALEHKLYKGFRLLAVDGSMVELPHGDEITKSFGQINHNPNSLSCGWALTFYDVLNEIIVDSRLNKYGLSERSLLVAAVKRLKEEGKKRNDIIVADRGFPSLGVIYTLMDLGYDFIIRYNGGNFIKDTQSFAEGELRDVEIKLDLEEIIARKKGWKFREVHKTVQKKEIRVRMVKVDLGGNSTEYLITSLLDKELMSIDDLKKIYGYRWGEEEAFKLQKCTGELENISGRNPTSVYQDYYGKILMMNLHSIIVNDAEEELRKDIAEGKRKVKYDEYKVNRNVSYGLILPKLQNLIWYESENWETGYDELVQEVKRYIIPVKPNRSFPRERKHKSKYPTNKRRAT